jgi:hypothetical protein
MNTFRLDQQEQEFKSLQESINKFDMYKPFLKTAVRLAYEHFQDEKTKAKFDELYKWLNK